MFFIEQIYINPVTQNDKKAGETRHRIFVNYKNTVFGWTLRDDVVQKH